MENIIQYAQIFYSIITNLDTQLHTWSMLLGPWVYLILFLIIFCETGLVVTPFLPGDSLLFALGALTIPLSVDMNPTFSFSKLFFLLTIAAILGDALNYFIGKLIGPRIFREKPKNKIIAALFKQEYLVKTQEFYKKHGGKTIVWARFIPIIRTYAPFVAGVGRMEYSKFAFYNIFGAIFWIGSLLILGRIFGNLPVVKNNFHLVLVAIIIISLLPGLIEWARLRFKSEKREITNT
jgi:membrane-associated protein